MKAVLVDAFDSFSHIIYQYLEMVGVRTEVIRSGEMGADEFRDVDADFVVLGPGPGTPEDSGHVEIVESLVGVKPVLGVCLGHQSIVVAFGGSVVRAERPMHGKTSTIEHDGAGVFLGRPQGLTATRYHSLVAAEAGLKEPLRVTARSVDDGYVMGVRHIDHLIEGIQFHPESVLTEGGLALFENFVRSVREDQARS
jgi:anthranilate synthase component 2